jgi:hypothetical protein
MFGKYVAGVSFTDKTAQIAVLRVDRQPVRLCHLAEFRSKADSPAWFLQPLFERDEKIYRKVKKVFIAVDHDRLFHYTLPVDTGLDQQARREHFSWELAQFLPHDSPKEYISDSHSLNKNWEETAEDVLLVAVKRDFIALLESELKRHKFECGVIDSAFFAAKSSCMNSHLEMRKQHIAMVGFFQRRIDIGFFSEGKLLQYRSIEITSSREIMSVVETALQEWPVEAVCVYGMNAGNQLVEQLHEKLAKNVFLLNPFKSLHIGLDDRILQQYHGREHVFAPAIGIVLMKQ